MTEHRAHHDMGGLPAGPVDRMEHQRSLFDQRVDAMMIILNARKQVFSIDSMRRAIEGLPPEDYDRLSYYEKWLEAMHQLVVERGLLSEVEIGRRIAELRAREREE